MADATLWRDRVSIGAGLGRRCDAEALAGFSVRCIRAVRRVASSRQMSGAERQKCSPQASYEPCGLRAKSEAAVVSVILFAFALALRTGDLDAMVNPDLYHLWSVRIVRFMDAVRLGHADATLQSHHPGVTLMWIVGTLWQQAGVLHGALSPQKVELSVWPIAIVGSTLAAATYPLLLQLVGKSYRRAAFLSGILLATEPMLVAHSRNAHLDILAITFAWIASLSALIALRKNGLGWAFASGICLGLALLSKISTAGIALGIALVFLFEAARCRRLALRRTLLLSVIAGTALATMFIVWPALRFDPLGTIERLLDGLAHEVSKGVAFKLFDRTGVLVVPAWVYGLFVVFLVTPEFWLLAPLSLLLCRGSGLRRFTGRFVAVTLPLIILVGSGNNVGVRNVILILPWLGTLSALGVVALLDCFRPFMLKRASWLGVTVIVALLCGRALRVKALHPLPLTYCATFTGVDCASVFHIGWGEGMKEAAHFVESYANANLSPFVVPRVFGSGYASIVRVWTRAERASRIDSAHLLIDYLPDWQRKGRRATEIARYVEPRHLSPLHEVILAGRVYVRIYPGPAGLRLPTPESVREHRAPWSSSRSEESSEED
jgi:hypothetical protein